LSRNHKRILPEPTSTWHGAFTSISYSSMDEAAEHRVRRGAAIGISMHIAVLTEFPVVCFANGPSLATQALKRYLENRGHQVTIVGPRPGPDAPPPTKGSLFLESVPLGAHPGVRLPFAWPPAAFDNRHDFDVVHGQANSSLMRWAPIMRELHGIPCLSTNTLYLPGFAQYVLPEDIYKLGVIRDFWSRVPARAVEGAFTRMYNDQDGLIVQCDALAQYWIERGLEVPLHVIPRPIDTAIFDQPLGPDPFRFPKGKRLLVVCRHAREKDLHKLLLAFARGVAAKHPGASLTLVGDGLEHKALVRLAETLGIMDRCDFAGEKPQRDLRHYYGHADLFVYTSLTETYGQVISEALWCGLPVVALDDAMGVAFQVKHSVDGLLVPPGSGEITRLVDAIDQVLSSPSLRRELGEKAAIRARERVAPEIIYAQYESAYASAIDHARRKSLGQGGRTVGDLARLVNRHVVPWTLEQALLATVGSLRTNEAKSYKPPKQRIDVIPETRAARPMDTSASRKGARPAVSEASRS